MSLKFWIKSEKSCLLSPFHGKTNEYFLVKTHSSTFSILILNFLFSLHNFKFAFFIEVVKKRAYLEKLLSNYFNVYCIYITKYFERNWMVNLFAFHNLKNVSCFILFLQDFNIIFKSIDESFSRSFRL